MKIIKIIIILFYKSYKLFKNMVEPLPEVIVI